MHETIAPRHTAKLPLPSRDATNAAVDRCQDTLDNLPSDVDPDDPPLSGCPETVLEPFRALRAEATRMLLDDD